MSDLEKLIHSLKPGDLVSHHNSEGEIVSRVLLRTEKKEGATLLFFSHEAIYGDLKAEALAHPDGELGQPLSWNTEKCTLVNRANEPITWCTDHIRVERGAGDVQAKEYARVPRLEHLRHHVPNVWEYVKNQKDSDEFKTMQGILLNGEAGDIPSQIALMLQELEIEPTEKRVIHIMKMLSHIIGMIRFSASVAITELSLEELMQHSEEKAPSVH